MDAANPILLKTDELGRIEIVERDGVRMIRRDVRAARWWAWLAAHRAAAREARALTRLAGIDGVPALLGWDGRELLRSYIPGAPMQQARPRERGYYRDALRLLARLHRRGIVHNDLAKEPNWLVRADGRPALVDFQLAWTRGRRGPLFRLLAREDLRHLLKHKRTYCPEALSPVERRLLKRHSWLRDAWFATGKPVYRFVTRKLLHWEDNEGQGPKP